MEFTSKDRSHKCEIDLQDSKKSTQINAFLVDVSVLVGGHVTGALLVKSH